MILHPRVDGAGAVDLFGEDKAGQLVGHRDAAHAEPERRRALDLIREAVGRADDEGHVSRAAVCAVGEELRQLLGGDLFSLDAQGDDGRAPADAAEDGSALFVQRLFHHGVGGVLLFDFFFRQLDDAERRKRRQTLLVFGHALGEVFRVELADADQVDVLHGYLLLPRAPKAPPLGELAGASPPERARPLTANPRHSDSIALTKSLPIAAQRLFRAGLALSVTFGDTSPKGRGFGRPVHFLLDD